MSRTTHQHIVYFAPPHEGLSIPYPALLKHAASAGITVSSTLNPAVTLVVAGSATAILPNAPTTATCVAPKEFVDLVKSATPPNAPPRTAAPAASAKAKTSKRVRSHDDDDDEDGDAADQANAAVARSPKRARPSNSDDLPPSAHVVVFTGTLPSGRSRGEATAQAQEHGYTVKNSITKATTILVYGDKAGAKIDQATKAGALVLSEAEWTERLGGAAPGGGEDMDVDDDDDDDDKVEEPVVAKKGGKGKAAVKPSATPASNGNDPSAHVVVFTGTLPSGRSRDEAIKHAESRGYTAKNSITKATTILVYGDKAGSKIDKAREQGVLVLSEAEWMARVGAAGDDDGEGEAEEDEEEHPAPPKKAAATTSKKAAPAATKKAAGSAKKGVVVFSGALPSGRTRSEATKEAEAAGYEVKNSITKATTILVTGEKGGAKVDKAKDQGVEVIDEDEWIARLQEEAAADE